MQNILVTGGEGYIGFHAVRELQQSGFRVIVLDNLVYGHRHIVQKVLETELIVGDVSNRALSDKIFPEYTSLEQ
ncbi:NAD-dependent epimerase/dehydratase family protein [Myxosarcina sp. GI1]|uniref:NAD-dependent epimerase/dehydratase family protein n=1 Tax=Myxosarcina sp. GI1 TaxID=1541065 RepID=UPI000564502F|nr:NAD-dependent epimerase/dehydratase family protein [Myxosarcina sp. GI1]